MSTTGEKLPSAASTASEDPWYDKDWSDPTNVYADDGNSATVAGAFTKSNVLKVYGFDFSSIPDTATINGVICRVNVWRSSYAGTIGLLQLLDTSRTKVGTNQCSTPVELGTDSAGVITKGASDDLWGNALTPTWLKDADFGVAIGLGDFVISHTGYVDYVSLEVYYTNNVTLTCDSGSYSLTGTDASLKTAAKLTCSGGTYSLTGTAAGLKIGYKLVCATGAYAITWGEGTFSYVTVWAKKALQTSYWAARSLVSSTWSKITDLTDGWSKKSTNSTTWSTKTKNDDHWTKV